MGRLVATSGPYRAHLAELRFSIREIDPLLRGTPVQAQGRIGLRRVDTPSLFFKRETGEVDVLDSVSGPQQGDPFGPFLFSLAIHDVITAIRAAHPRVVLLAYLDDIFLLGDASDVAAAFRALRVGLASVNLEVNTGKCKAHAPDPDTDLSPLTSGVDAAVANSLPLGLPVVVGGCIVLGVPVGATAAAVLVDAVASVDPDKFPRALAKKLAGIDLLVKHGRHYTALLLLSCCAAPTVNNLLRAQPPRVTLPAAREADTLLRGAFLSALDIAISEVPAGSFRERLIHLRTKSGGLGIQSAADTAGRAFLASWAACGAVIAKRSPHLAADIAAIFPAPPAPPPGGAAPPPGAAPPAPAAPPLTLAFQRDLQDQRSILENELALDLSEITLAEPKFGEQRRLGELAAKCTRTALGAAVAAAARGRPDEEQTLAWWHSTAEQGRGAYLQRFALWKPLPLRPLAMAVRRHLRLPLPELRDCGRCACGAAVSAHGDHADCCRLLSGLRSYRHNELRDAGVLAPCKQVGLPAYREEPHIVDGTADRPADALIIGRRCPLSARSASTSSSWAAPQTPT